ncbi:Imm30 family immunity protein [Paenibacillus glycanilyticus]|uniref:Imm30 family immunity protein n=1 Tax=Paenibacillus glycanilyticus TaxID=126569 RepID=UPI0020401AE8|nr:Imm30 family immunity protein [Paenibacillus glycanilyticus]MCM3626258.1 Imm30 family immunity protein [Paenibacillus glycanilyticus]
MDYKEGVNMKLDENLATLKLNRFMRTESEILLFEKALKEIYKANDYRIIGQLIDVLEDETEHFEVMWGIIHTIEYLSTNSPYDALKIQVNSIPDNNENCREWIDIIHYRILNHDEYRVTFATVLKDVNKEVQKREIAILNDIKNEDPEKFEKKVKEVLTICIAE